MRMRRIAASAMAAAVVIGGTSLVAAPAAWAAIYQIDGCQSGTFTMLQDDVVVLVFEDYDDANTACDPPVQGFQSQGATIDQPIVDNDLCATVTLAASDSFVQVAGASGLRIEVAGAATVGQAVQLTCGDALPAADTPPIPDWLQQYQRAAATSTCADGWSPSWAFWANDGTGGFVCTRTVPMYGN